MSTNPWIDEIENASLDQCAKAGIPVTAVPNAFGGFDVRDQDDNVVRLGQEDPQAGVELFVLDPNRILRSDARFGRGFPAAVVAQAVCAGFGMVAR